MTKKLFCILLLLVVFTFGFSTIASATEVSATNTQALTWYIPEYEEGIGVFFPASADCMTSYSETGNKVNSIITLSKHEIFSCAENWTGKQLGYDLDAIPFACVYYDANQNYLNTIIPTIDNDQQIVDPSWIWEDKYSTDYYNTNQTAIDACAESQFNCSDAITQNQYVLTWMYLR